MGEVAGVLFRVCKYAYERVSFGGGPVCFRRGVCKYTYERVSLGGGGGSSVGK